MKRRSPLVLGLALSLFSMGALAADAPTPAKDTASTKPAAATSPAPKKPAPKAKSGNTAAPKKTTPAPATEHTGG